MHSTNTERTRTFAKYRKGHEQTFVYDGQALCGHMHQQKEKCCSSFCKIFENRLKLARLSLLLLQKFLCPIKNKIGSRGGKKQAKYVFIIDIFVQDVCYYIRKPLTKVICVDLRTLILAEICY